MENKSSRKRKQKGSSVDEKDSMAKRKKADTFNENTKIDTLPNDILVEIIKSTPIRQWSSLEGVNRQFREAVFGAWRCLKKVSLTEDMGVVRKQGTRWDATKENRKKVRLALRKLLRRSPSISSLIFDYKPDGDSILVTCFALLQKFCKLESIDFGHEKRQLDELTYFLETSASRGRLKELSVNLEREKEYSDEEEGDTERRLEFDADIFLSAFGNDDPNLPQLKLEKLSLFTEENCYMKGISRFMDVSRLTMLDVSKANIYPTDFVSLLNRATNLTKLVFSFGGASMEDQELGVDLTQYVQISQTVATLENLKSLHINESMCGFNANQRLILNSALVKMIRRLGRRKHRLEELHLLDCILCDSSVVVAIGDNMPRLKSLSLNCTSDSLVNLVSKMACLDELWFARPENDFETESEVIDAITASLTSLKSLSLDVVARDSGDSLKRLTKLVNLKNFAICYEKVNTSLMKAWSDGFGSNLEVLILSCSCGVTDKELITFLKQAPRLRGLRLNETEISDRSLRAIVKRCPDLRHLDLSNCENVSAKGVQAVVDGCLRLENLTADEWICKRLKISKFRKLICLHQF